MRPAIYTSTATLVLMTLTMAPMLQAADESNLSPMEQFQILKAQREIDKGVPGKAYAYCDDHYVLYHNDQKLSEGYLHKPQPPRALKLKPGDTLTVKATSAGGRNGFSLIFHNSKKTVQFSTNTRDWHVFTPADPKRWWEVKDFAALKKSKPGRGSSQEYKGTIETLSELACEECIWGEPSESTVFFVKQVTYEDLMEN